MIVWDYPSAALRTGILIVVCGLALAGCSKKTDVTTEAPKSQVVAKIGNQVVTVQELDNEFRLDNVAVEKRKDPEIIRHVLGELVTRKYLVQQAIDAKLDREPTVLLDILRSRDLVLANALASRDVTTKNALVSKSDIDSYIANNPLKFANRQLLSVEQLSFPLSSTSQAVIDATREMSTLDQVDQKLTAMGVPHGRSAGTVSTGDLPQNLLSAVNAKKDDDIFFIRSGANGVFFKVTRSRSASPRGDGRHQRRAAISQARHYQSGSRHDLGCGQS